jgi:hypothetical protein
VESDSVSFVEITNKELVGMKLLGLPSFAQNSLLCLLILPSLVR